MGRTMDTWTTGRRALLVLSTALAVALTGCGGGADQDDGTVGTTDGQSEDADDTIDDGTTDDDGDLGY